MRRYEKDILDSPIQRYYNHGNNRPSQAKLESYQAELGGSSKLTTCLAVADIAIDLAMVDKENSERHLEVAEERLTLITEQLDYLYDNGYEGTAVRTSNVAVTALLRKSDLDKWALASENQEIVADYTEIVKNVARASEYVEDQSGWAKLLEYMPVLLFDRAHSRGLVEDYTGRQALAREDNKPIRDKQARGSWDCALMLRSMPSEFDHPDIKLQIKATKGKKSQKYTEAGILPIRATVYGFYEPDRIIKACLEEIEAEEPSNDLTPGSHELDKITLKLLDRIIAVGKISPLVLSKISLPEGQPGDQAADCY